MVLFNENLVYTFVVHTVPPPVQYSSHLKDSVHQDWRILVGHFKVKLSFRKLPFHSFCLCLGALDQILSPSQSTGAKINMEQKGYRHRSL